ncbi:MAG TPA: hypothetical protein VJS44_00240 [Pyrinomonadaceae bacterium]|nr:hypothetical protein [Pyrinomonadaceae bacterium]
MRHLLRATHLPVQTLVLMLFVCAGLTVVQAQDDSEKGGLVARKFDEFERVGGCDHGARLDNFAIQLMEEPTATGYLIVYGPEGKGAGTGESRLRITEDYLVNTRGVDPARFKAVYGGRYKEMNGSATEMWIVPEGAEPPEPQTYTNKAATFTGLLTEYNTDESLHAVYEDAGTGPAFGDSPLAGLSDALRQQPDKVCYVVAFNSSDAAPGSWRRAAREVSGRLESGQGIAADRIKIIYGGYRQLEKRSGSARVQLWVGPANVPPVPPVQEPEPRPDKAVQIVSVNDYVLAYEDNSRLAFEAFAEILKADEQMKACVIIRLEVETEDEEQVEEAEQAEEVVETAEEAASAQAEEAQVETPKLDLIQLVEKWKSDLEQKYGISRDRLIVLTGNAQEYQSSSLETWVVPPGAALPDPSVVEEEEPLAQEEETAQSKADPQQ